MKKSKNTIINELRNEVIKLKKQLRINTQKRELDESKKQLKIAFDLGYAYGYEKRNKVNEE